MKYLVISDNETGWRHMGSISFYYESVRFGGNKILSRLTDVGKPKTHKADLRYGYINENELSYALQICKLDRVFNREYVSRSNLLSEGIV